jgi:hypothetical protein
VRPSARRWIPLAAVLSLAAAGLALAWLVPRPAASAPVVLQSGMPTLAPEAGLGWDVRDSESGNPIPCKLTLIGVDGTPTPAFTRNDIGRQEGEAAIEAYNRIMAASGIGVAHVPFGTYDVYISRGPEWDLFVARRVRVGAGGARVTARLAHVVDTHRWVSADLHVHASASTDSRVPMHDRIYEFLSDGVEVIVSTDHNVVSDYAPIIEEMGVGRYITSVTGDELTTGGWGHFGAFPLVQDRDRAGHGAVTVHGHDAVGFFKNVRQMSPEAVIDVHHPRIDNEIGYFNLAHFDAQRDQAMKPGWSWDFDAVEVLNGYQDAERRSVDRVIADWFWLLDHGHTVTATGNSDTHHLNYNIGGYPRNYIRALEDRPSSVTPVALARAIKSHRSFFTTGPFVRLRVDGAEMGETVTTRRGVVRVEVEVQAAPWVSVSSAALYVSGKEAKRWAVPPSAEAVRLRDAIDVSLQGDGWIVARVDGDKTLAPVVGDNKRFDVRPLALTNPVFVDVDGNGMYDAPLAPAPGAPPTGARPPR